MDMDVNESSNVVFLNGWTWFISVLCATFRKWAQFLECFEKGGMKGVTVPWICSSVDLRGPEGPHITAGEGPLLHTHTQLQRGGLYVYNICIHLFIVALNKDVLFLTRTVRFEIKVMECLSPSVIPTMLHFSIYLYHSEIRRICAIIKMNVYTFELWRVGVCWKGDLGSKLWVHGGGGGERGVVEGAVSSRRVKKVAGLCSCRYVWGTALWFVMRQCLKGGGVVGDTGRAQISTPNISGNMRTEKGACGRRERETI